MMMEASIRQPRPPPSPASAIRLRLPRPPSWITLLMLGTASSLFGLADGCLRQSPSASSSSSASSNNQQPAMSEPSTAAPSHMLPCYDWEKTKTACLHGGQCFVLRGRNGARHASCKCTADYIGERCQEFFIDPSILESRQQRIRTAHMTAAISVCVLVFFVVFLMIYVYIKYRRKAAIPMEAMRGPRLEIGEYYNYNQKVPWLSSFKKKPEADHVMTYAMDNDVKPSLPNGPEGVDCEPLLEPGITNSNNGSLARDGDNNNLPNATNGRVAVPAEVAAPRGGGLENGSAMCENPGGRSGSAGPETSPASNVSQYYSPEELSDIDYMDATLPRASSRR